MKNKKLQLEPINQAKNRVSVLRNNKFELVDRTRTDESKSKKTTIKEDQIIDSKLQIRSDSRHTTNRSIAAKFMKGFGKNILKQPDKSSLSNESSDKLTDQKITLKEMVENASIDVKLYGLLEDTYELINEKSVEKRKTEQERYELIDKTVLENLKTTNEELKNETNKITDEYNDISRKLKNMNNELIMLSNLMNKNERNKSNYINKTFELEGIYRDVLLENEKLNAMINKEIVEKDNILRALVTLANKNRNKLPKELKEIYDKVNNDFYNNPHQVDNNSKVETLKNKIQLLEKEMHVKINDVEKKKETLKKLMDKRI